MDSSFKAANTVMVSAITDIQVNDSILARRARDLVARHSHFYGRAEIFEFECSDNVLLVRGRVPTFYLKQLLGRETSRKPPYLTCACQQLIWLMAQPWSAENSTPRPA